jgi:hypothetical protein
MIENGNEKKINQFLFDSNSVFVFDLNNMNDDDLDIDHLVKNRQVVIVRFRFISFIILRRTLFDMSISKDDLVDVYKCNARSRVTIKCSFSIIRILFNT